MPREGRMKLLERAGDALQECLLLKESGETNELTLYNGVRTFVRRYCEASDGGRYLTEAAVALLATFEPGQYSRRGVLADIFDYLVARCASFRDAFFSRFLAEQYLPLFCDYKQDNRALFPFRETAVLFVRKCRRYVARWHRRWGPAFVTLQIAATALRSDRNSALLVEAESLYERKRAAVLRLIDSHRAKFGPFETELRRVFATVDSNMDRYLVEMSAGGDETAAVDSGSAEGMSGAAECGGFNALSLFTDDVMMTADELRKAGDEFSLGELEFSFEEDAAVMGLPTHSSEVVLEFADADYGVGDALKGSGKNVREETLKALRAAKEALDKTYLPKLRHTAACFEMFRLHENGVDSRPEAIFDTKPNCRTVARDFYAIKQKLQKLLSEAQDYQRRLNLLSL